MSYERKPSYNSRPSYDSRRDSYDSPSRDRATSSSYNSSDQRGRERSSSFSRDQRRPSYGGERGDHDGSDGYSCDMIEPAPMPGEWETTSTDVVPHYDKELVPEEERPEGWMPPTPPRIDLSLMQYAEEFRQEREEPPVVRETNKDLILREYGDLRDDDKLVLFDNECVISTNFGEVRASKAREGGGGGGRGGFGGREGFGGDRRGRGGESGGGDRRGGGGANSNLEPVAAGKRKWGEGEDSSRRDSRGYDDERRSSVGSRGRYDDNNSSRDRIRSRDFDERRGRGDTDYAQDRRSSSGRDFNDRREVKEETRPSYGGGGERRGPVSGGSGGGGREGAVRGGQEEVRAPSGGGANSSGLGKATTYAEYKRMKAMAKAEGKSI